MLDILTANPDVWSKTVLLITYDENDGFFDHMVPPTPPQTAAHGQSSVSIINEIYAGSTNAVAGPYGMGARVPMIVVSPWSKGGWVNSQVFDHTSIIRFIEQRFGANNPALTEPNITPWRRTVAGDLTSAFDFRTPNRGTAPLPATSSFKPVDALRHPDYVPLPPLVQALPPQESGIRRARALPYRSSVQGHADMKAGAFHIGFGNDGSVGTVYQVRSSNPLDLPRTYTVEPHARLKDSWLAGTAGAYDLSVYGPNGFLRAYRGAVAGFANADLVIETREDAGDCGLVVELHNRGHFTVRASVLDAYSRHTKRHTLTPGEKHQIKLDLAPLFGWYDVTVTVEEDAAFRCQIAGHVETGRDSVTDPAISIAR